MNRTSLLLVFVATLIGVSSAHAVVISHQVDPMDNLYYTDWGHPYNIPPFDMTNIEFGALGTGDPAEVVSGTSGPENFAGFGIVNIVANGLNAINGTVLWGPDGAASPQFRGLNVYSLIGVWSSSGTSIVPIPIGTENAFFVGSENSSSVPDGPSAYLWLGFNDGKFDDNLDQPSPGFDIPNIEAIPEPASSGLLLLGLCFLAVCHRRSGRARA